MRKTFLGACTAVIVANITIAIVLPAFAQPTCEGAKADVKRILPVIDVFARIETLPLGERFKPDSGVAGAGGAQQDFYYAGDTLLDCEAIVTLQNAEWYRLSYVIERRGDGKLYVRARLGEHLGGY